jgi:hypothetical protein
LDVVARVAVGEAVHHNCIQEIQHNLVAGVDMVADSIADLPDDDTDSFAADTSAGIGECFDCSMVAALVLVVVNRMVDDVRSLN